MELVYVPEVTVGKMSGLGTTLLKCWVVMMSRLLGDGLKELCCTLFLRNVKMSSICKLPQHAALRWGCCYLCKSQV
jgi:hypothetical protein